MKIKLEFRKVQKEMHKAQIPAHCIYFASAAAEAIGYDAKSAYGIMAAILLVLTLPEILEA